MRYVIAVGGNALKSGKALNKLSASIVRLFARGNEIVITHGNGPQVGRLALHEKKSLAALTKETQKEIGKEIKRSISAVDREAGAGAKIIITHVIVNKDDAEFVNPTKPIGDFYGRKEAERLARKGFVMKRLLKGYRRVVPSPRPVRIVELSEIERVISSGRIAIAAGGGGIAVTRSGSGPRYADAVIDKDLASALLAIGVHADRLFILTNVDGVYTGFRTKHARLIARVKASQLRRHALLEHFESGSMMPKVRACISFVRKTGKYAVIGNLARPWSVISMKGATVVAPD